MEEENGKILLQPSFIKQQQQTQHITTKLNNNNKTNTDINDGRTKKIQTPFQDFKGQ